MPHIFHTYYSFPASDHLEIFPLSGFLSPQEDHGSDDPVTYHCKCYTNHSHAKYDAEKPG